MTPTRLTGVSETPGRDQLSPVVDAVGSVREAMGSWQEAGSPPEWLRSDLGGPRNRSGAGDRVRSPRQRLTLDGSACGFHSLPLDENLVGQ